MHLLMCVHFLFFTRINIDFIDLLHYESWMANYSKQFKSFVNVTTKIVHTVYMNMYANMLITDRSDFKWQTYDSYQNDNQ